MNILMIEVPTIEKDGSVPFGLLYAASSAYRAGHNVRILDLVKEDLDYKGIKKVIDGFSPDIIGMGGITSSYRICKELIKNIKNDHKNIPIVIGGVVTSVSDLLLEKASADIIVHGEGEITFVDLIEAIKHKKDLSEVKGISFMKDGKIIRTGPQPQINNLDDIPMPNFELLDMKRYLEPIDKWVDYYFGNDGAEYTRIKEKLAGKGYLFPIITARGCTHRCIFCYRHHKGLRQNGVKYVVNMMKYLKDKYDVKLFQINDELTTGNRQWVLDFCDTIINERLDIYFIVLSSRVDTVDETILLRLKQAGCVMINYGYETGSNAILKEIKKGVTREQALKAGLLTKKVGIKNIPEIIIGFPSETEKTIGETVDFLKQLDAWPISINTPIPFPETPLWDYAIEHNLIKDDMENYILNYHRHKFINFTRYSDNKLRSMVGKAKIMTKLSWLKNRKNYLAYMQCYLYEYIIYRLAQVMPDGIKALLRRLYRKISLRKK